MKLIVCILPLILVNCGFNGNQKVTQTTTQEGTVTANIVIQLGFIEQIRQMCQDLNLKTSFETEELWKQAIAQCTFKNLSLSATPTQGTSFVTQYCSVSSDLSALTAEQQIAVKSTCKALGY